MPKYSGRNRHDGQIPILYSDHIMLGEEDKKVIDKEMKHVVLFRNIKGRIFAIFKPSNVN